MTQPEPARCGTPCGWRSGTTCTDPAGHNGPHAGPLVIGAKEVGVAVWGPDQPEPAQPRHTADSITDDALTAARTRHLPDDIAIHYQNAVNAVVAAEQRAERAEARRAALKRAHVALAEQAGRNQAALDAVRKLHRPAKDWSWKTFGCNHDGAHAQSCGRCKTCHPCDTVRALDAHTTPTETT